MTGDNDKCQIRERVCAYYKALDIRCFHSSKLNNSLLVKNFLGV